MKNRFQLVNGILIHLLQRHKHERDEFFPIDTSIVVCVHLSQIAECDCLLQMLDFGPSRATSNVQRRNATQHFTKDSHGQWQKEDAVDFVRRGLWSVVSKAGRTIDRPETRLYTL